MLRNSCLVVLFLKKYRSSHRRCSVREGVLKNFANSHRKTPVLELFYEFAGLQPTSFLKGDSNTGAFL